MWGPVLYSLPPHPLCAFKLKAFDNKPNFAFAYIASSLATTELLHDFVRFRVDLGERALIIENNNRLSPLHETPVF